MILLTFVFSLDISSFSTSTYADLRRAYFFSSEFRLFSLAASSFYYITYFTFLFSSCALSILLASFSFLNTSTTSKAASLYLFSSSHLLSLYTTYSFNSFILDLKSEISPRYETTSSSIIFSLSSFIFFTYFSFSICICFASHRLSSTDCCSFFIFYSSYCLFSFRH